MKTRKILALLLSLAMVIGLMTPAAMATEETGETTALTATATTALPEAVDGVITLTDNVTLTEMLTIPDGKTVTLDLNGKTVKAGDTVDGSSDCVICVAYGADLTIKDSVGTGVIDGSDLYGAVKMTNIGDVPSNGTAKLTVDGGKLIGNYYAIVGNGGRNGTEITINDGTITATQATWGYGVFHPQDGTLTVNGGTIEAATGIEMRGGTLNVTGGTIKSTAGNLTTGTSDSGTTVSGAAIALSQHTTNHPTSVTVTGGTLSGPYAFYQNRLIKNYSSSTKISATIDSNATLTGEVAAAETDFAMVQVNGAYSLVAGESDPAAMIGTTGYATLADAVAAATDGQTVTLLADVADCGTISLKAGVTLDGDGRNISGNSCVYMATSGATVVKNVNFKDIHNTNTKLSAIYATGLTSDANVTITGCTFENIDYEAIQLTSVNDAIPTAVITGNVFKADTDTTVEQRRHVHIELGSSTRSGINLTIQENKFYGDIVSMGMWYLDPATTTDNVSKNYVEYPSRISVSYDTTENGTYNAYELALPLYNEALTEEIEFTALVVYDKNDADPYASFANAITDASKYPDYNPTVKLLKDIILTEAVTVGNEVTLNLNSNTIALSGTGSLTVPTSSVAVVPVAATGYTLVTTTNENSTTTYTVTPIAVTGVTLDKATLTLTRGNTSTLTATVAPADALNKTVTWSSSNTSVATVDANGKVTAVAAGTTTITATADGKTATCTVTVSNPSSGSSSSNTTSSTEKNPDGSTTTTTTNKTTGTVTETTKNTDGSSTTVETKKDGTVTTTEKTAEGVTSTVVENEDGDVIEVTATVPTAAANTAAKNDEPVTLPVEVEAATDSDDAVEIEVNVPSKGATVEIPVDDVTPGTVVVIVDEDGNETIVPTSTISEDGVVVTLEGDATIKVIDNSKDFVDVPEDYTLADSIDFVSARGLFEGTTETTYNPHANTTVAQTATVLARLSGEDFYGAGATQKGAEWAAENGLTDGTEDVSAPITRQQMVLMMWRLAGMPMSDHEIDHHTDDHHIDDHALVAMQWAVEHGILTGYEDGSLKPHAPASRAHVAAFTERYVNTIA